MALKIRFLLTSRCTATCAYCHNEGQSKKVNLLSLETITRILRQLHNDGIVPDEIVLSGGEPTLHKHVAQIARLCRDSGAHVSMDTHGGHPSLLLPALPYLDEIKLHIDSFDPETQFASMGIQLAAALESAQLAKKYPLQIYVNHPVQDKQQTLSFVRSAREHQLDCKLIELHGQANKVSLNSIDWTTEGYLSLPNEQWQHTKSGQCLVSKRCGAKHNDCHTLFIGTDGIRRSLNGIILCQPEQFHTGLIRKKIQPSSMPFKDYQLNVL